jgi:glycosyltransferase involved in cell wall biosynthesis
MSADSNWIVCQLGAREHYAIPLALHRAGRLAVLFTDIWVPASRLVGGFLGMFGRRLGERHVPGLESVRVIRYTASALAFEFGARLSGRGADPWSLIIARNDWFQGKVLQSLGSTELRPDGVLPVVFSYSYAAREIFRRAKDAGCTTVLGQIDPGPIEEDIVEAAVRRHVALKPRWSRAPEVYWRRWREECELADRIVVNSEWAKTSLIKAGIDINKIKIIPLPYDGEVAKGVRTFPPEFSRKRPLRVLFLGSLIIRKGIAELLDAIRILNGAPIEFHLVGSAGIEFPSDVLRNPQVLIHGPVPRGAVSRYYAGADLFILPSLSDGFGLTQLEALAHGLPTIASRHCGDVVEDAINGLRIDPISGEAIASALLSCLGDSTRLNAWARAAVVTARQFRGDSVASELISAI